MEYFYVDGRCFYNMLVNACNKLEKQKEYVNSLNVFPVPDGDTGTNMFMTFKGAVNEIECMGNSTISDISKQLSKGALMSARGNSGVILSQIFRGIAKGLENAEAVDPVQFASSILEGSNAAYKAVMRPTEGTILTIIRAAGESAVKSENTEIIALMEEVCHYSEEVLNKTPDMLPVLKKAKVVDAGGMGLLIILKGMLQALKGEVINVSEEIFDNKKAVQQTNHALDGADIKFGYCTEFFIKSKSVNLEQFKNELSTIGDSMIVVGVDEIVKVHIHTNDPGVVLSKALALGELSKIKIDNMREQHNLILEAEYGNEDSKKANLIENETIEKYAFISVASGEGISQIFKDLGVKYVIQGGQTMNPSTQDVLQCIDKIKAENIFILPNNKNIVMAATQAKELSSKNVVVIPTKTIPEGITCLTEFSPEADLNDNIKTMTASIDKVVTGLVTFAVRDTEIDGKNIKEGDILGIVANKINEVGNDIYKVSEKIIEEMVNEHSELISVYYGQNCEYEKVQELVEILEKKYPDIDVQCNNGEQPLYYFILSVE